MKLVSVKEPIDEGLKELEAILHRYDEFEKQSGKRHIWVNGHHYLEDIKTNERVCIDKYYAQAAQAAEEFFKKQREKNADVQKDGGMPRL